MNDIKYVAKHLRTYSVQQHTHSNWEIIYCTSGSGEFVFPDKDSLPYVKGEIIAIPPNIKHSNVSEKGFTNIYLNLGDPTFPFRSAVKIADGPEGNIMTAFNEAFFYFNSDIEKKELILSALGDLIASYIIALQCNVPLSDVVEQVRNNIVSNYPDPSYKLDEYMRSIPFSYDYLRKLFKTKIGMTPHAYLTAIRMQTAGKLLLSMKESNYNITEISLVCGYDEPLYFSRVFKKYYDCSPLNYVKKNTVKK